MDPTDFGSGAASACVQDPTPATDPDRITKTIYDAVGQVTQVKTGVGTALEANEVTSTYTLNGKPQTLTDGENNKTTYEYDSHDRLSKTLFPVATKGANASSTIDYEQLSYDANSNVTSRRLRDGQSIALSYDNLNQPTLKDLPGSELDVSYGYDNLGRLTSASQTGHALSFTYDALGRSLTQVGPQGTVTAAYDIAGRRTQLTYPGSGLYVSYDHLVTGEVKTIRENGATSGVGVLATFAHDDLGRRTSLTRGNGTSASYTFDAASRLSQLVQDMAGTTNDLTLGFTYNPASQIKANTRSNDAYSFALANESAASTVNGLNQLLTQSGAGITHDAKGNLTGDGTKTYGYSAENLLTSVTGGYTLGYDPMLRLHQLAGTRFGYDGLNLIAEYDATGALTKRYVHGPGVDEPLVQYEGPGTTNRTFLHADERGSIVSLSDSSGNVIGIDKYDEYGNPQGPSGSGTLLGRFGYTGQAWLPELQLYYYKARMYDPKLQIFPQTDPIWPLGGMNGYAYTSRDPVNLTDPSGLQEEDCGGSCDPIVVTGRRLQVAAPTLAGGAAFFGGHGGGGDAYFAFSGGGGGGGGGGNAPAQCPATSTARAPIAVRPPAAAASGSVLSALRAVGMRALGLVGAILSLGGDSPQPRRFRHYGYASQAGNFAGGLYPGSFATTASGPPLTGQQAQSLLALPARSSVPDAYYNVTVSVGVPVIGPAPVVRANGQPGGGVQYRFPNGTPPGSVGPPNPIPAC